MCGSGPEHRRLMGTWLDAHPKGDGAMAPQYSNYSGAPRRQLGTGAHPASLDMRRRHPKLEQEKGGCNAAEREALHSTIHLAATQTCTSTRAISLTY